MSGPNKNIGTNSAAQDGQIALDQQDQIAALQDEVTRLTCELGECRETLLKLQGNQAAD